MIIITTKLLVFILFFVASSASTPFFDFQTGLLGATDLHETHFRRSKRKIRLANQAFPNDIMSDVYARSLKSLDMGEYTRYMIGWTEELHSEYVPLLTERFSLLR